MNCSEIQPNLEAYALSALDPYHLARVELHLQTCAACRHTLASFRKVVGELPHALSKASPLRPPPSLKNQIMQAAQADAQAREQARAIQETFAPRAALKRVSPAPNARRVRWLLDPRHSSFALGSAILVIALLFVWLVMTQLQLQQSLLDVETLRQQSEAGAPQTNQVAYIPAPDILLQAPDSLSKTYAILSQDPARGLFVVRAYGLGSLPTNQEYVLWATTAGETQRVGTLSPLVDGSAVISFLPTRNLLYYKADGTTATADLAAQNPPILKKVWITRQDVSNPLPSNERVLLWRASPNEEFEEFNYWFPINPLSPPSTAPHSPIRYE